LEGLVADVGPSAWTVGKSPAAMIACPLALMIRRGWPSVRKYRQKWTASKYASL
jgi:integral membrane sensor domain MASE1